MPKLFLKPPVWAFWALFSLAYFIVMVAPISGLAQGREIRNVETFTSADLSFAPSTTIPITGWAKEPLPANKLSQRAPPAQDGKIVAWARIEFDRADFGDIPIAVYTENNREGVMVFLNGIEIMRNNWGDNARALGWNRPYLIALSPSLMKATKNEIIVRASSRADLNLSLGQIKIGSQVKLTNHYNWQFMRRISGPMAANVTMLFLTLAVAMLIGRFGMIVPMLAVAGALVNKPKVPESAGTFPTNGPLFVGLMIGVILIVGGLTFFPALALGPLAEHAAMLAKTLY